MKKKPKRCRSRHSWCPNTVMASDESTSTSSGDEEQDILSTKELSPYLENIQVDDMVNKLLNMHVHTFYIGESMDPEAIREAFRLEAESIESTLQKLELESGQQQPGLGIDMYDRMKYVTGIINDVLKDFNQLEQKASRSPDKETSYDASGYQEALHIREALDKSRRERDKARELRMLIVYFEDFYHGKTSRIESLASSDAVTDLLQLADILKKLTQATLSPALKGFSATIDSIQLFTQDFEKRILYEFQLAYQEKNDIKLASYAKILNVLNGGHHYVQSYVQNHEFFSSQCCIVSPDQIHSIFQSATRENLDVTSPPALDPTIEALFSEIRRTCHNTWTSIAHLLEQPHIVMMELLQKIFTEIVHKYIEVVLDQARHHSLLAYVKTLHSCYIFTRDFIFDIQNSLDGYQRKLDSYLDDLFSSHISQNLETLTIKHLLSVLLGGWDEISAIVVPNFNSPPIQLLSSLLRQHAEVWPLMSDSQLYYIDGQPLALHEYFSQKIQGIAERENLQPSGQLSGRTDDAAISVQGADRFAAFLFSTEILERAFTMLGHGMIRIKILYTRNQLLGEILALFDSFLAAMIDDYLGPMLDTVKSNTVYTDDGAEYGFTLVPLRIISVCSRFIQLCQLFFQENITGQMLVFPVTLREAIQSKNDRFSRLHEKMNDVIFREMEGLLGWVQRILNKQPLDDYETRKDGGNSATCNLLCKEIKRLPSYVYNFMDGNNVSSWIEEFGAGFFALLLDHMRRFRISETGAVMLNSDLSRYQEIMGLFKHDRVGIYFGIVKEIGKLFLIQPGNLKRLLKEGRAVQYQHYNIPTPSLYTFIICRNDFVVENFEEAFQEKTHYQSRVARIFQ